MQYRTTFALDGATIKRLKILAKVWHVSQAEVVRRSVEKAEREASETASDLFGRLDTYQRSGRLDEASGKAYLEEVAENRAEWGRVE